MPNSVGGDDADARIRSFIDQRVWPPLTWFDFALIPNLLETHLVAKENMSSADGGRQIISALLHATIDMPITTRPLDVDIFSTDRSSSLFHLAAAAAESSQASLCQLEEISGLTQSLLRAMVCATKADQKHLQSFDFHRWRLRRYLRPPDFSLSTQVGFQIGEAFYSAYTKDRRFDLLSATKLAIHAGNILEISSVLAVVKYEFWASMLIELGEWMLCFLDTREVLSCLQLCERLIKINTRPSLLPWNPPGHIFTIDHGNIYVQNCSSMKFHFNSLSVVSVSLHFLSRMHSHGLDVPRSLSGLPSLLSHCAKKSLNMAFCTICKIPSRYGYVRALAGSGTLQILVVQLLYIVLLGALQYRPQILQILQTCHSDLFLKNSTTDFCVLLHLLQTGAVTSMDMQPVELNLFHRLTRHTSSILHFIRMYVGTYWVEHFSADTVNFCESGLKRNMPICWSCEKLRNCTPSATSQLIALSTVLAEARWQIFAVHRCCEVRNTVSADQCLSCGMIRCSSEKTKKRRMGPRDAKLADMKNALAITLNNEDDAVGGLLMWRLSKSIAQATWACRCKALSLESEFSFHSCCIVPCIICIIVVNLVSRPSMNIYNNSQATCHVMQATDIRQWKLLNNLSGLNNGFL